MRYALRPEKESLVFSARYEYKENMNVNLQHNTALSEGNILLIEADLVSSRNKQTAENRRRGLSCKFHFLAVQVIFICVYITNYLHFFTIFLSF